MVSTIIRYRKQIDCRVSPQSAMMSKRRPTGYGLDFGCRRVSVPDGPRGQVRRTDRTIIDHP